MLQTYEIEWACIYRDSVKGDEVIEKLNLNIGRWAGNYSFFYVLYRVLSDFKPSKILELGLGESSKFISTYIKSYIPSCEHTIVEHSSEWIQSFKNRFNLSENTKIVHLPIINYVVKGFNVNKYTDFEKFITEEYCLYVIDGPFGSDRFSRYDIITLVEKFMENEFIIIIDDTNRIGENDTVLDIVSILNTKKINFYKSEYVGNKTVSIIASEKFKYTASL